jgi:soluble lytic murein transglycosylase-like protein
MGLRRSTLQLVLLAAAIPAAAREGGGQVVVFEDGRALVVRSVERRADLVVLHLEAGGLLAVPAERIAGHSELPAPAPVAPVPASPEPGAWRQAAGPYADLFARSAAQHGLDPAMLTAMAQVESALDPAAVSPKGACGILQLMPETAGRFGVLDPFDPEQNVEGGARYLQWLLERYDGRTELALAGYNAGEGAVDRHGGIPPYRETRQYVRRVLDGASRLAAMAP